MSRTPSTARTAARVKRPAARAAGKPAPRRGPGRPPAAPEAHAAIRRRLLDATRAVFTRTGYHGLSVELVLAESGLSRPTFYKHFRNSDDAVDAVIQGVNDDLIAALLAAVAGRGDPYAALEAGLIAWRDWGHELGDMLRPLFAELHDAHSPASRHRRRTLAILGEQLVALVAALGRPRPTRLQVDALLNGVEYLGYRFHLETPRDTASWQQTRDGMLRIAFALLGSAQDWQHAATLARTLHIDLEPRNNT
jgi:AcrR family transcriptional regulator